MINRLNVTTIFVLDKDEALDFYVNKLGLEKGNDVRQGDYRWLTIRVPGEPGTEVSPEQPGAPLHDEATIKRVVVSTYQSVSGAGKEAMDELFRQTRAVFVADPAGSLQRVVRT